MGHPAALAKAFAVISISFARFALPPAIGVLSLEEADTLLV